MRKSSSIIFTFVTILIVATTNAHAQNAQIVGSLKDQTGGVLPGATVTARNQETGLLRTAVSDAEGNYRLPALPPGVYTVSAELVGFGTETRPDILLVIDQTAILAFTLKPATVAETITVTGESPIVDTTASAVATSVSSDQIQDLPVASRRWIDLAMLVPGTSQDNIRGQFYRGNVNIGAGTREYSNMFMVDGTNNNWAEMGEARQNFPMDAIREFKVSTSTYKAEYGLATGGLLTVVTKSGTNQLHGSGLLFFRDKALTARTFFETVKPAFRRYQYGGTIGGPILRDRTHYFYAFERTDEDQFFTVFTRGIWPEEDRTHRSDQNRWTYTARVDHQLSQGQSIFLRFAQEDEYRPIITAGRTTTPSASFDFAVPRTSAVIGHTWILNNRALNDFRFQYGFSKYEVQSPLSGAGYAAGDFSQARLGRCTPAFNYPTRAIGGCNTQMGPEHRYQFKEDFSYLLGRWGGRHQWKMGVDYNYITFQADLTGGATGTWTFPQDRVFDPNDRRTWPTQYTDTLPRYADTPVHHLSAYAQNDWEATGGLTVNVGLRWDLQTGVFNEDLPGLLSRIEKRLGPGFGYPLPIPFHEGADRRGDWNNFGPRIGLAWDPRRSGRMNVHAAYGMFYDNIRTLTNHGELTWPQGKQIVIPNPSFPDPFGGRSRSQFLSTAPPNITVLSNDLVNPYAHQYNVGLTRMITSNIAATADVTIVHRYSDRDTIDPNLPDQTTRQRPFPQFARVSRGSPTSDNRYKALLVKVERRLSHGYQFLMSYTLSKADDSAMRNDLADRYGYFRIDSPASADRRHRLVASGIVQLPWNVQLSGILDLRSSLPFNTGTSLDINRDGYTGDLPAGVSFRSGCRDLNIDALNTFRGSRGLAAVTQDGIACPGFSNADVRLSKTFSVGAQRLELIAQLFNVAERANFAVPISNPASAAFGQVNGMAPNINAPSRQVEFAVRYQF
ncbi:MAG: TonB-dependent receptor [Acidobacteria bacterium]|nr:TonB-dependent receptor [Acidobacteriota bacterium]